MNFVSIYKHFGDFVKWFLRLLLQIQHENNFLPTGNPDKPKFVAFSAFLCTTASFVAKISSAKNVSERDAILAPVANSQEYSELREPVKTRENFFSLIW